MGCWDAWVGRTKEQSDILTTGLLRRFYATIDSRGNSETAPQGIHWCLCLPEETTADLGEDGHLKRGSFMPPIRFPRRMWAASDVTFHAPLATGMSITRRSTIVSIAEKQGASGPLVFATLDHETFANGVPAISERQSIVYREAPTENVWIAPNDATTDLSGWPVSRTLTPSEALLFRYSALTFNSHRIHYDYPYATSEEGYRGLVVHGPLIAVLLIDLATREYGPNILKQFSMRAQAPAFVGDPLYLACKSKGQVLTLAALGNDGRTVMTAEGTI